MSQMPHKGKTAVSSLGTAVSLLIQNFIVNFFLTIKLLSCVVERSSSYMLSAEDTGYLAYPLAAVKLRNACDRAVLKTCFFYEQVVVRHDRYL